MNIVDSSGWLEYFADGVNADFFAPVIEKKDRLLVPVITLYEVFKRVLQQRSEEEALQAVSIMQEGQVIDLNTEISINVTSWPGTRSPFLPAPKIAYWYVKGYSPGCSRQSTERSTSSLGQ